MCWHGPTAESGETDADEEETRDLKGSYLTNVVRKTATVALLVVLFGALLTWAGLPAREQLPAFLLGAGILGGLLATMGYLGWYLLLKPLPTGHKKPAASALKPGYRRLLSALVAISGINIVVGGFWDEVWHRKYGLPFGEDLLWRPHLLLYAGFTLLVGLSFFGLIHLLRRGRGSHQQRFRADPIVGLLVLVGGFLIYALPADPLWHIIYGEDISAWSLPHLVLTVSFLLIVLLAAAIQLSTVPARRWAWLHRGRSSDVLPLMMAAFGQVVLLQVLTTEWDTGSSFVVSNRPEWLLPALLTAVATFTGAWITHATRLIGAGSAAGLIALGIRGALVALFGYDGVTASPWIAALPALLGMDVWYALNHLRRSRTPDLISTATAALAAAAIIGYPVVNALFFYPTIGGGNLFVMLLASFSAAVGGSWLGRRLGDYLGAANKQTEGVEEISLPLRLVPVTGLAGLLAFIAVFIITASPPV